MTSEREFPWHVQRVPPDRVRIIEARQPDGALIRRFEIDELGPGETWEVQPYLPAKDEPQ